MAWALLAYFFSLTASAAAPPVSACAADFARLAPPEKRSRLGLATSIILHSAPVAGAVAYARQSASPTTPDNQLEETPTPAPRVPRWTEEKLLAHARQAVQNTKAGRSLPGGISLGEFWLQTEFPAGESAAFNEAVQSYRSAVAELKEIGKDPALDPESRIKRAMELLHERYFQFYCGEKTQLADFLRIGCGNCQSQSKLTIAALADAEISLPAGYRLGAQLYADHVAPVLLKEGEVWDLVTNRTQEKTVAPVFTPSLLFQAYLQAKSPLAPEGRERLVLAGKELLTGAPPIPSDKNPLFANSNMRFDFGVPRNINFSAGPAPKFARLSRASERSPGGGYAFAQSKLPPPPPPRRFRVEAANAPLSVTSPVTDPATNSPTTDEPFLLRADPNTLRELGLEAGREYSSQQEGLGYAAAALIQARLAEIGRSTEWRELEALLAHPQSRKDLTRVAAIQQKIRDTLDTADALALLFPQELYRLPPNAAMLRLHSLQKKAHKKIENDAAAFVKLVNGRAPAERDTILEALVGQVTTDLFDRSLGSRAELPTLTAYVEDPSKLSLYRPKTTIDHNDVVILFEGDGTRLVRGEYYKLEKKSEKKQPAPPPETKGEVQVTAAALAGLRQRLGSKETGAALWTPELERLRRTHYANSLGNRPFARRLLEQFASFHFLVEDCESEYEGACASLRSLEKALQAHGEVLAIKLPKSQNKERGWLDREIPVPAELLPLLRESGWLEGAKTRALTESLQDFQKGKKIGPQSLSPPQPLQH